jgi:signal transduction histidine kinase
MALVVLTMSPVFILFLWSSGDQRDIALETTTASILADAHATADRIESVGVELVSQASAATNRGADLTSRLLAFSRRQPLAPKMLNLNELVLGTQGLLARTLGDAMVLEYDLEEPSPVCVADANQLNSALLNLVLNARDAMPGGGRITMSTGTPVHIYLPEQAPEDEPAQA